MTLLSEYRRDGRILFDVDANDVEVINDSDDAFLIRYYTSRGEPIVMGVNRNEETFWRNRDTRIQQAP